MPIIGPYASGESVLLRQLLFNLWRLHKWKFLLTSFEENVKPRYQRDFRRHLIGRPMCTEQGEILWSDSNIAKADIWEVTKVNVWFIGVLLLVLLLVTYVPVIPMGLVELFYG